MTFHTTHLYFNEQNEYSEHCLSCGRPHSHLESCAASNGESTYRYQHRANARRQLLTVERPAGEPGPDQAACHCGCTEFYLGVTCYETRGMQYNPEAGIYYANDWSDDQDIAEAYPRCCDCGDDVRIDWEWS